MSRLHSPPRFLRTVTRPRLLAILEDASASRVVLVVGPPGSGKSTLLAEWAGALAPQELVWVTVAADDDSPTSFDLLLTEALGRLLPDLATELADGFTSVEAVEQTLDALAAAEPDGEPSDRYLVLDDAHLLRHPTVRRLLLCVAERSPRWLHLVLASRADPAMPLHRMRVLGDLLEVREEDLRFSSDETATFLSDAGLGSLEASDVRLLEERTEGWAAGLQLAVLSLRRSPDPHAFLAHLAGTERHIADYLVHEVLDHQPEDLYWFLLRTSPFDRLTPGLCRAVTGCDDSAGYLETLEREQLFLRREQSDDDGYRYHALFRQLLQFVLRSRHPAEETDVLRSAAAWHDQHGDHVRAIDEWLAAGDLDAAVAGMDLHAADLLDDGRVDVLARWTGATETLAFHPDLWVVLGHAVRLGWAERRTEQAWVLSRARELLAVEPDPDAEFVWQVADATRRLGACEIGAAHLQLSAAVGSGEHETRRRRRDLVGDAARHADLALSLTHLLVGDSAAARALAAHTRAAHAGHPATDVFARAVVVLCDVADGYLSDAEDRLATAWDDARAFRFLDPGHPAHQILTAASWSLWLERNELDRVLEAFESIGPMLDDPEPVSLVNELGRLEVCVARGELDDARSGLDRLRRRCRHIDDLVVHAWLDVFDVRLLLATGRLVDAQKVAGSLPAHPHLRLVAAEVELAAGTTEDARARYGADLDSPRAQLEAAIVGVRASVLDGAAPDPVALAAVVRIGSDHGLVRPVLHVGAEVKDALLDDVVLSGTPFVARLRDHWEGTPVGFASSGAEAGLVEPLSERERQVLRYLTTRLLTREIAAELYVSVNTLKTHIQAVYRKLDCSSRREAVDRARELNLLSTH